MREISKEELAEILDKHQKWLNGEDGGEQADLSGSDLRYSDLSGSNLRYSNLCGSDLRYSDLCGSDLRYSDLCGSDLSGSDLRYSDLSGSDLRYSDLRYSDLCGSDLRYSDLCGSDLSGSDLRYSDLSGSDLRYSDLRYSDLSDVVGQFFISQRSDGHQFFLVQQEDSSWKVRAGCRYMSIEDYRKHTESYGDESKRVETNLILDFAEAKLKALHSENSEAV